MTTPQVWIESMDNLHCPTCDTRLVETAGRFEVPSAVLGTAGATKYVGRGAVTCPAGHQLPNAEKLVRYRDQQGHPADAPFNEIAWPWRR